MDHQVDEKKTFILLLFKFNLFLQHTMFSMHVITQPIIRLIFQVLEKHFSLGLLLRSWMQIFLKLYLVLLWINTLVKVLD